MKALGRRFYKKNVTYDKPTTEVMDSNFGRRADHFVIFTDISRSEIDENVNDEHDINCRKKDRNSIRMNFIWILLESIFMKMYVKKTCFRRISIMLQFNILMSKINVKETRIHFNRLIFILHLSRWRIKVNPTRRTRPPSSSYA